MTLLADEKQAAVQEHATSAELAIGGDGLSKRWLHLIQLSSVVVFVMVWALLSRSLPPEILPGPADVLSALWDNLKSGQLFFHTYRSLVRVFLSFLLAMAVGCPIGAHRGGLRDLGNNTSDDTWFGLPYFNVHVVRAE
jgi:hypothetical protein